MLICTDKAKGASHTSDVKQCVRSGMYQCNAMHCNLQQIARTFPSTWWPQSLRCIPSWLIGQFWSVSVLSSPAMVVTVHEHPAVTSARDKNVQAHKPCVYYVTQNQCMTVASARELNCSTWFVCVHQSTTFCKTSSATLVMK
jgi:hypothetical protein